MNRLVPLTMRLRRALEAGALALVLAIGGMTPAPADTGEAALWQALRDGGHIALMRHALAPGTGDPPSFTLGDCTTQRNLDAAGRNQARRIGARFRASGIASARVLTSQWCRCRETAALLGLGPPADLPALNSFFGRPAARGPQMRALRAWLRDQAAGPSSGEPVVLVTHQVVVTALTGIFPSSGEIVVVRANPDGTVTAVGSIETD